MTCLKHPLMKKKEKIDDLNYIINSAQKRLDKIQELSKHIRNYSRNNLIYLEYKKAKKDPKFKKDHDKELQEYMDAKHYFDSLHLDRKLPSLKELNIEFQEQLAVKRAALNELYPLNKEHRRHLIYQENVRLLLDIEKDNRTQMVSHEH